MRALIAAADLAGHRSEIEELPLSADAAALLEERLREDEDDPDAAVPWATARKTLDRGR